MVVLMLMSCFVELSSGLLELLGLMVVLVWMVFLMVWCVMDLILWFSVEMMLVVSVWFRLKGLLMV